MIQQTIPLTGLRTIIVARCSEDGSIEESIPKQLELGRGFVQQNQMVLVDELTIEGKSATLREHEPALRALLERKILHGDFECLVFLCMSRFDRVREAGDDLFEEFERAGVLIVTQREGRFDGEYGWLLRKLFLHQAQSNVEELALHTATGTMQALKQGKIPHTSKFPFGLDREYRDVDGKVQFRLRDIGGSEIQRIDPTTQEVTYTRRVKNQKFKHLLPKGSVTLVPGKPEHLDLVREIFTAHYRDGLGGTTIARRFNDKGIAGPSGGPWWKTTVEAIYGNPLYCGLGRANRETRANYVTRGKGGAPIIHKGNQKRPRTLRGRVKTQRRHPSEWFNVEYPQLRDILPDITKIAEAELAAKPAMKEAGAASVNAAGRRSGGDRHVERSYVLSGLLRTLKGNHAMVGAGISKGSLRYRVGKAINCPNSGETGLSLSITKDLVEQPVFDVLVEVLNGCQEFRHEIERYVRRLVDDGAQHRGSLDLSIREKKQIEDEYLSLMSALGTHGRELAKARIAQLERRLDHLAAHIKAGKAATHAMSEEEIEERVQAVLTEMNDLGAALRAGKVAGRDLQAVLKTLIGRLVVDAGDRSLHMDLRLPKGVVLGEKTLVAAPGVVAASGHQTSHESTLPDGCILASYRCTYMRAGREACYQCMRKKHAA